MVQLASMIVQWDETMLIASIRNGNKKAFQQVFDTCYEGLCHYAFTLLKDDDDAEDIVQSMFLKVWEKRESLDIQQTIRAYLFRAVYNQCINHLEHRQVKWRHQQHALHTNALEVQLPEVFPEELQGQIKTAIDKLPAQCRAVFMLSRYEELRYAQIAAKLNISINTVENQISKALRILRSRINDDKI